MPALESSGDKIRASLGHTQSGPASTADNRRIGTDPRWPAGSCLATMDVSLEMTEFVHKHILSQSPFSRSARSGSLSGISLALVLM